MSVPHLFSWTADQKSINLFAYIFQSVPIISSLFNKIESSASSEELIQILLRRSETSIFKYQKPGNQFGFSVITSTRKIKCYGERDKQELRSSCKCFLNKFIDFSFLSLAKEFIRKWNCLVVWISSTTCCSIRSSLTWGQYKTESDPNSFEQRRKSSFCL